MILLTILLISAAQSLSVGAQKKLVDLGYGFDEKTIAFPGGAPFKYTSQYTGSGSDGIWFSVNDFATAEHCGTHIDAPYHFDKNGRKVGEIPLDRLITKAVFVNASKETSDDYKYKLPASKLIQWEEENGKIPDSSVLIVGFGWAGKYPNRQAYLGPTDSDLRYPGLSKEAAQWIVDSKRIVGVGVDTPSADQGSNTEAHVVLNTNDVYILENVNLNHDSLPGRFDIVVMPMMLNNGTGAPCRIIAELS